MGRVGRIWKQCTHTNFIQCRLPIKLARPDFHCDFLLSITWPVFRTYSNTSAHIACNSHPLHTPHTPISLLCSQTLHWMKTLKPPLNCRVVTVLVTCRHLHAPSHYQCFFTHSPSPQSTTVLISPFRVSHLFTERFYPTVNLAFAIPSLPQIRVNLSLNELLFIPCISKVGFLYVIRSVFYLVVVKQAMLFSATWAQHPTFAISTRFLHLCDCAVNVCHSTALPFYSAFFLLSYHFRQLFVFLLLCLQSLPCPRDLYCTVFPSPYDSSRFCHLSSVSTVHIVNNTLLAHAILLSFRDIDIQHVLCLDGIFPFLRFGETIPLFTLKNYSPGRTHLFSTCWTSDATHQ